MFAKYAAHAVLVVLCVLVCAEKSAAQAPVVGSPTPLSKPGGYANLELQNIYRQDVGTGYSANSLNSISLQNARARSPYYGPNPTSASSSPRVGLNLGGGSMGSKPFSGFTPQPTVSPYLNLFRDELDGNSDLNYNTLVQPQLQQQQFNQQVQRQNMELSRRLQSISAQSDFNAEGSKTQYPTGHQTTFMYYGHYYPSANVRPRR